MSDIDSQLKALLDPKDGAPETLSEPNFYREVWESRHGEMGGMVLMTWAGIIAFGSGLIYCVYRMVKATDVESLVLFAAFAIMLNSAQIALKLWYNMRLNRTAILRELRRLRLDLISDRD
ncbi:MAG: DUF6768 family protein [Pseudomonadota bacterium]